MTALLVNVTNFFYFNHWFEQLLPEYIGTDSLGPMTRYDTEELHIYQNQNVDSLFRFI